MNISKRTTVILSSALAAATLSLTGCGSTNVNYVDASWPHAYKNLTDLKKNATLAVAGTFSASKVSTESDGIPTTTFTVTVDKVLLNKSGKITPNSTIPLLQTGSYVNGVLTEVRDDPLFQVGSQALLFLRRADTGVYVVIGGPTGRYNLNSHGQISPFSPNGAALKGSIATVQAQLKKTS